MRKGLALSIKILIFAIGLLCMPIHCQAHYVDVITDKALLPDACFIEFYGKQVRFEVGVGPT